MSAFTLSIPSSIAEEGVVKKFELTITINGKLYEFDDVPANQLLIDFLHERLRLTGAKLSCGIGSCSACKVAIQETPDGPLIPVLSCYARMNAVNGMYVTTVESLAKPKDEMPEVVMDDLHPLQQAFLRHFAFQCGFCTPGFLMAARILIDELQNEPIAKEELPERIQRTFGGHLCRCTGYVRFLEATREVIEGFPGITWLQAPAIPAPPAVQVLVTKRSGNDLSDKTVVISLPEIKGEATFARPLELESLKGKFDLSLAGLRSGERVRDINLRKILFAGIDKIGLQLNQVVPIEERFSTLGTSPGPLAVMAYGSVNIKLKNVPVVVQLNLTLESAQRLRIRTLQPIEIDLRDLGLPVPAFALEFGLNLKPVVSVVLDASIPSKTVP